MGAFLGVPSLAISGLNDNDEKMMSAINSYILKLLSSSIISEMKKGEYLTMSIPRVSPEKIKGVKFVKRMSQKNVDGVSLSKPVIYRNKENKHKEVSLNISTKKPFIDSGANWFNHLFGENNQKIEEWSIDIIENQAVIIPDTDVAWFEEGYIVLVPMQANENNIHYLNRANIQFPNWTVDTL